jgi:hypothetical protein
MTKESKELLFKFKDLCARLPYGVICYWRIGSELTLNLTEYNGQLTCINKVEIEDSSDYYYDCYFNVCNDSNGNSFQNEDVPIGIVKPYLRPMSSMTEEELYEVQKILGKEVKILDDFIYIVDSSRKRFSFLELQAVFDWLNAHHLDYRGLIPIGLAIEAPEGMYNDNRNVRSY